jgi:flavin-dependent dehydrogenase
VIGADGAHSRVADAVRADRYHCKPTLAVAYYSYWSGIPVVDASWAIRPRRG